MLDEKCKAILDKNFINKFDFLDEDLALIYENSFKKYLQKNEIFYAGEDCVGFIVVAKGALRAFMASDSGKEITIFSIKSGECCLLCDTCKMGGLENKISVQTTQDSSIIILPMHVFARLKDHYSEVLDFSFNIMADRFAKVINVMEQIVFKPLANRILDFLKQNAEDGVVKITHEELANHIASAREAVSRVLKELERSGKIEQNRGKIKLL